MNDEELICNSVKTGGCTRGKKKNLHKTSGKKNKKQITAVHIYIKRRGEKKLQIHPFLHTDILSHNVLTNLCTVILHALIFYPSPRPAGIKMLSWHIYICRTLPRKSTELGTQSAQ